ncbi:hypothetical protein [Specibacter cremeus]|uniref:hypothetical protein n=1 Tax=Specibacter cremeus TaxID=1629051 RepID=UPI001F0BB76C|nr:hypothetical protein [Specibacter cremeus]
MTKLVPLPEALFGHSFTVQEARRRGVSKDRLGARDLTMPTPGVRVPQNVSESLADRLRPFIVLDPACFASHVTAACLHRIPLPWRLQREQTLHLSRPLGMSPMRRAGVVGHRLPLAPGDLTVVSGIPVTTPARTLLDLSALLSLDDLVAAADYLICEHHHGYRDRAAIVPADELRAHLAGVSGVRGLVKARHALELMRVGADSPQETKLRLILYRAGLPEFVPDVAIEGESGERPLWADVGCRPYRVCGEYEGEHHLTPQKQANDRYRDQLTARRGWLQVKVYAQDMRHGDRWVAAMFDHALRERGWTP